MVKWLRRRPLTAESGVRVPLGVPYKVLSDFFCILTGTLLLTQLMFHIKTPDTQGRYSGTRKTLSFTRELTHSLNASPLGSTIQSPFGLFCILTGTLLLTQLMFHIKTPDTQGRYSGTRKTLSFTRELTHSLNASPLGSTTQSPKGLFLCI